MSFRNRYLFIAFALVSIIALSKQLIDHYRNGNSGAYSNSLSGIRQTLSLKYVNWSFPNANWYVVKEKPDTAKVLPGDCIFIEPATADLDVPARFWALADSGYLFRVKGEFYAEPGIPEGLTDSKTAKPPEARIFHYTDYDIVKPE